MCVPLKGKGLAAHCSDVPCSPLGGGEHDNWSWRISERDKVMLIRKLFSLKTGHHARCPVFLVCAGWPIFVMVEAVSYMAKISTD